MNMMMQYSIFIICVLGPYIGAINIVEAWQECCSASDFCCTTPTGSDNGVFHKPRTAEVQMFAGCYIQGDIVTAHDCPAGWTYQQEANQCLFYPSSWEKNSTVSSLAAISTVKSCVASNNCPSPEIICGNPTVRIDLRLEIHCILQGHTNETCPAGWKSQSHGSMKQCIITKMKLECGNSVGKFCSDSSQNCTRSCRDDFCIFALSISLFVLIILIIVVKVRRDLKKKAVAQNVAPSNELIPIATSIQSQPMQVQGNIVQQSHNQPIEIQRSVLKYKVNQ